jgi:predicted HTH domain antitoxin
MGLHISSDQLREAGLDEREALVEFACRLFQAGKLSLWPAAKMAGVSKVEMEAQLRRRGIPIYSPTLDDLREDMENIKRIGA